MTHLKTCLNSIQCIFLSLEIPGLLSSFIVYTLRVAYIIIIVPHEFDNFTLLLAYECDDGLCPVCLDGSCDTVSIY